MPAVPFTPASLDRADALRSDDAARAALWARGDATAVVLWRGKVLLDGDAPARLHPDALQDPWLSLFLGLEHGAPRFAVALDPAADPPEGLPGAFGDLRLAAGRLSIEDASALGTARTVFSWHRSHGFCARCGHATTVDRGGWRRTCTRCDSEHFPRVDPVVIMLITHRDRILLGRAPSWPAGMFSCLAGFLEPGETVEAAARREAMEEASVEIGEVTYLMSQPWPFPRSLMLGLRAEARSDAVRVDGIELAEARWFSRAQIAQVLDGTHPDAAAPAPIALAHHLIRWWIDTAPAA